MNQTNQPVTLIGLGPMGQSMARAFLAAGHPLTVWNRTAAKSDALAAEGAVKAESAAAAVAANELIVLSLTHYQAMYAVLEPIADSLAGKVIVNLGSDTPQQARRAAVWATDHGARYLVGGFMSIGPDISHELSYVFYSGPQELFHKYRSTLEILSPGHYLGEDAGLAQLYYQALLDMFVSVMGSFEHSLAMLRNSGVDVKSYLPYAQKGMTTIPAFMAFQTEQIASGVGAEKAELLMMKAAVEHIIGTSRDAGVDSSVQEAILELYERSLEMAERTGEPVDPLDLLAKSDKPS